MSAATLYGLCAAALVGIGLYGLVVQPHPLRKILAFNVLGSGVFLFFGVVARRGAAAGFAADPVPQAMVITGIVVAFASTALAVALLLRLFAVSRDASLRPDAPGANGDATRDARRRDDARTATCSCWRSSLPTLGIPLALAARRPLRRAHRCSRCCRPGSPSRSRSPRRSCAAADALVYVLGGWAPPLGIALRADGLSAAMLLTTAIVIGAAALFARADFGGAPRRSPRRARRSLFWIAAARGLGVAQRWSSSAPTSSISSSRSSC